MLTGSVICFADLIYAQFRHNPESPAQFSRPSPRMGIVDARFAPLTATYISEPSSCWQRSKAGPAQVKMKIQPAVGNSGHSA